GGWMAYSQNHREPVVQRWEVATGRAVHRSSGHDSDIWAIIGSPDGSRIATGGDDGTARVWDAATGKPLHTFRARGQVLSLAFSRDGQVLEVGDGEAEARLWDVRRGKPLAKLQAPDRAFNALTFTPDGKALVTGHTTSVFHSRRDPDVPGSLRLWEAGSGRQRLSLCCPEF